MDVWMTQARRISKCSYCPEPIRRLEPEVIGKSRWKVAERTFTRINRWHPQCWITQGLSHIEAHPVIIRQGRPRLALEDGPAKRRLYLLRRHAQWMHYYRKAMDKGNLVYAIRCALRAQDIAEKIAPLGGIPISWRPKESVPS